MTCGPGIEVDRVAVTFWVGSVRWRLVSFGGDVRELNGMEWKAVGRWETDWAFGMGNVIAQKYYTIEDAQKEYYYRFLKKKTSTTI